MFTECQTRINYHPRRANLSPFNKDYRGEEHIVEPETIFALLGILFCNGLEFYIQNLYLTQFTNARYNSNTKLFQYRVRSTVKSI